MIIVKMRVRKTCTSATKFQYESSKIFVRFRFSHEFWIEGLSKIFCVLHGETFSFRCYSQRKYPLCILAMSHFQCQHFVKSRPAERRGGKGNRLPQGLVLWGASDCKGLILKNSSKWIKSFNPEWNSFWSTGNNVKVGGGASLWMTTFLQASCCLSGSLVKSTECICCIILIFVGLMFLELLWSIRTWTF